MTTLGMFGMSGGTHAGKDSKRFEIFESFHPSFFVMPSSVQETAATARVGARFGEYISLDMLDTFD